ncbi:MULTISPECIES: CaiB/BaiF CoA transferase family protein [unclassified Pseudomonas]|uniref:CaiB/BaiF CoA transferase family protein n=1 Tax=unclassified Pseudomonas TaxID=196821 RepID=UPI0021C907A3|nr:MULTISPECIES: CaiB/BaiF CoA-transferase family protein [unclassified Pseudomonas]MCU1732587.1 CoA transferase [Pseudomonas sp. 20P_3.2_Bac4]MCU1746264.1 CoA transferase [Pseudomonas sp. 20P_3.2_Bac5]
MGPLQGVKVVELSGIGPAPFCAMVLADLGADVVRIVRPGTGVDPADVLSRNRPTVEIDIRGEPGQAAVLALVAKADILIEGFRPGVMEKNGLGPTDCHAINPRLIYGRMTGWGQYGPLAQTAGHDLNYIALTGALHGIGRPGETPPPPVNFIGDFGGGGMLLLVGVLAALHEAAQSGAGQVIDAAMTDGTALLSSFIHGLRATGHWRTERGANLLDGAAPFYDTYRCADGRFVALGAIEPQFYQLLRERCGLDGSLFDEQMNQALWPSQKQALAGIIATRTRDEWCVLLEGSDACFAPVLDWDEAPEHAHNRARETFINLDGVTQPAPAPRFSRTAADMPRPAYGASLEELLRRWEG